MQFLRGVLHTAGLLCWFIALPQVSLPELTAIGFSSPLWICIGAVLFQSLTGTRMNHVPYKGAAPAVADLLPGRIQVWIGAANTLLPHIKDGKLKLLGISAPQRFATLPDTPTIAESGVPGYALDPWLGLFMPARVPQEIVAKVHAEVLRILNGAELKARLGAQGIELVTSSPAEFARFIRDDNAKWGRIIKHAGIKGD